MRNAEISMKVPAPTCRNEIRKSKYLTSDINRGDDITEENENNNRKKWSIACSTCCALHTEELVELSSA